jgi:hypothetical protein
MHPADGAKLNLTDFFSLRFPYWNQINITAGPRAREIEAMSNSKTSTEEKTILNRITNIF